MSVEGNIDWGFGELAAFGSLLVEGTPVRLAGQDSRRGTFVQRHAVLHDRETGAEWTPLLYLSADQAKFWVYDSSLSEYAALGFEYGYSVERPDALVLWEAQFGDFVNGAQTVIDEFISSAEQKWGQYSSVVMLLPTATRARAGPLVRAHRALPPARGRGQHDGRAAVHAGVVLPPAPPAGVRAPAPSAHRLHAEAAAAPQGCRVERRGLHDRHVPPGDPGRVGRPGEGRPRAPVHGPRLLRPARRAHQARRRGRGAGPPRAAVPARRRRHPGRAREVPGRRGRLGPGRARRTRAPGRSCTSTCPRTSARERRLRPASASTAAGTAKKHQAQQAVLLEQAFAR